MLDNSKFLFDSNGNAVELIELLRKDNAAASVRAGHIASKLTNTVDSKVMEEMQIEQIDPNQLPFVDKRARRKLMAGIISKNEFVAMSQKTEEALKK